MQKIEVLKGPRITEKTTFVAENKVYTFDVDTDATKTEVAEAVEMLYKVKPVKVRIVKVKARNVVVRGKRGKTAGGKKAYVYLKKSDSIDFMK